jgi:hypothetical protein
MATKPTATSTTNGTRKTTCPITRQEFRDCSAAATPTITIAGQGLVAVAKEFNQQPGANGASVGYSANGKVQLMIGGKPVMCQVGINITVIGSKDLPEAPRAISPEVQAIRDAAKVREAAMTEHRDNPALASV